MPIGIFLFALKTDFQKSEENVEKRRKPETISGFLFGIFFVKTHWRRHPEVRPPLRFGGGFEPDSDCVRAVKFVGNAQKKKPIVKIGFFFLRRVDKKDAIKVRYSIDTFFKSIYILDGHPY